MHKKKREIKEVVVFGIPTQPTKRLGEALYTGVEISKKGLDVVSPSGNLSINNILNIVLSISVQNQDPYGFGESNMRIRGIRNSYSGMTTEGIPNYGGAPIGAREYIYEPENLDKIAIYKGAIPSVTVGVIAATYAMTSFKERYNTWKDIQVETNSKTCSLDGIQLVTGCTIANKLLTIVDKEDFFVEIKSVKENKGVIVKMKNKGFIDEKYPEFSALRNKLVNGNITDDEKKLFKEKAKETSLHLVETPIEELFIVESF